MGTTVSINTGLQNLLDALGREPLRKVQRFSTATTATMITAPDGESKITVFAYEIQSHGSTVGVTLKDSNDSTAKTPTWKLNDREGTNQNSILPLFVLSRGGNLQVTLDAGVEVDVAVSYTIKD